MAIRRLWRVQIQTGTGAMAHADIPANALGEYLEKILPWIIENSVMGKTALIQIEPPHGN